MKQQRTLAIILGPDPCHPGGVTRAIETWLKGGLAEYVDIQQVHGAGWDAPLGTQILQTARAYIRLIRTLAESRARPRVVHIHVSTGASLYREWIAMRLTRLFGVALVSHLHSGHFGAWVEARPTRIWFARDLFRRSGVVVVPGQRWLSLVRGLGARNARVVPHALDERLACDLAAVAKHVDVAKRSERTVLLYYGRWAPVKGLDVLAEAVGGLDVDRRSRLSLRVFGNGDRQWLEQCLAHLTGTEVYIGGWLSDEAKARELSAAHAFVSPSRSELFGQVLLEVMAAGRPVIATRVGGVPDVLDGYPSARLVAPDDPRALQGALEELLDGRWPDGRHRRLGQLRSRFLAPNVAVQLAEIYQMAR
jgi:glycosyltransferase involved in cell wall biosynthesis